MRKKLAISILCIISIVFFNAQIVYAQPNIIYLDSDVSSNSSQLRLSYIKDTETGIKKAGSTVLFSCDLVCKSNTAKCSITVYLQKKTGSSSWTTIETFSDSAIGTTLSLEDDKVVSSGIYRITAYYHAYTSVSSTSPVESISVPSSTVTIS